MADEAKRVITRNFTVDSPKDEEDARKRWRMMVAQLGQNKFYPNTEYDALSVGTTTVNKELQRIREIYGKSGSPTVRALAKLSGPELLQHLRQRGESQVKLADDKDAQTIIGRQKAIDTGTGS